MCRILLFVIFIWTINDVFSYKSLLPERPVAEECLPGSKLMNSQFTLEKGMACRDCYCINTKWECGTVYNVCESIDEKYKICYEQRPGAHVIGCDSCHCVQMGS